MKTTKFSRLAAMSLGALSTGALVLSLAACGTSGTGAAGDSANGAAAAHDSKTVTLYSADGLGDWYKKQFDEFTKKTGIKVNYVEGGSGEVVSRAAKEKSNPQMDVVVTLPPFIQQADKEGLLEKASIKLDGVPKEDVAPDGNYVSVMDNYFSMIRSNDAQPQPDKWSDLLDPKYQGKIQYSTPGQAGDGTALLVLLEQEMGKEQALTYLGKLQANNVGPSASTGKLGPKVSTGELAAANSDLQMGEAAITNDHMNYNSFLPQTDDGTRATVALPYVMGLGKNAPNSEGGKKLMEFLLSKEVQEEMPQEAWGYPVRTDVTPSGENYAKLHKAVDGVKILRPDWDEVLSSLDDNVAAYNKATGQ